MSDLSVRKYTWAPSPISGLYWWCRDAWSDVEITLPNHDLATAAVIHVDESLGVPTVSILIELGDGGGGGGDT